MFWNKDNKKNKVLVINLVNRKTEEVTVVSWPAKVSNSQYEVIRKELDKFYLEKFHVLYATQEV